MKRKHCKKHFPPVIWIPVVKSIKKSSRKSLLFKQLIKRQILLRDFPWTRIISYKCSHGFIEPSINIANVFMSTVYLLRQRNLTKRKINLEENFFDSEQGLIPVPYEHHNKYKDDTKRKSRKQSGNDLSNSIVSLRDLADGIWLWKKAQTRYSATPGKGEKIKKLKKIRKGMILSEKRVPEAEIPKTIEEQMDILFGENDQRRKQFFELDCNKSGYLGNYEITNETLYKYVNVHLKEARNRISCKLRKREE